MANEKRLIDANALMAYICNHDYELVSRMGCVDKGMFTDGIEHGVNIQPTVDAVEVVHGEWVVERSPVEVEFRCSECGYTYIDADSYAKAKYNYCPNCGAKMDGGNEDV